MKILVYFIISIFAPQDIKTVKGKTKPKNSTSGIDILSPRESIPINKGIIAMSYGSILCKTEREQFGSL